MSDAGAQRPRCPVCRSTLTAALVSTPDAPAHCNVAWRTKEAALRAPVVQIELRFCADCGHTFNSAFEADLVTYPPEYESSLHGSPRFQEYVTAQARDLSERHGLRGRTVIEIGCGRGEFLSLLCQVSGCRGIGFDPSLTPDRTRARGPVVLRNDMFTGAAVTEDADLICCRQTLEHVPDPRAFLATVRDAIGHRRGAGVFFEVPNALLTLRDLAIFDVVHEHVSYFSPSSLTRLFEQSGFAVADTYESYDGQFLCIHGVAVDNVVSPGGPPENDPCFRYAASFPRRRQHVVDYWRTFLKRTTGTGRRVALWGAGSKGVTFLNMFKDVSGIELAADLNPRKQGRYLAGSGARIVAPDALVEAGVDIVLAMNPIYAQEIAQLMEAMALRAQLVFAWGAPTPTGAAAPGHSRTQRSA